MIKTLIRLSLCTLIISNILLTTASAEQSMRRCMLLPIQDSVGGAIGFEVFKQLESYLRNSEWCYYETNSPVLDILANYRRNLAEHLQSPDVLKVIADRTRAGSLIRINIESEVDGVNVKMDIIGSNGEDRFFSDETKMQRDDPDSISRQVRNWLNEYERSIPYDAKILGVLGDQFTFEMGQTYGVLENQEMEVVRMVGKERHPLLDEIVSWDTVKIADARAFQVGVSQTQARVQRYEGNRRVEQGDWVILKRVDRGEEDIQQTFRDDDQSFGSLGTIGVFFNIGTGSNNLNDDNESKKISGKNFGGHVDAELWITRNYWAGLEIGRKFGSYSVDQGQMASDSNSISDSLLKIKGGYRYLPMGFFYGPQVDAYIGYARYGYGFDNVPIDGITAVRYAGLLAGVKGNIPIHEQIRVKMELDFIFKPSFKEDIVNFGSHDSATTYHLRLGASYMYRPNTAWDISVGHMSSKTEFKSGDKIDLKDTDLRLGMVFTF